LTSGAVSTVQWLYRWTRA